jgi:hypothetical protein
MTIQADLLTLIEVYLSEHPGMPETTFGVLAVNNGKLVRRLRTGGNITVLTIDRVKAFMVAKPAPPKRKSGAPTPSGAAKAPRAKAPTPKKIDKRKSRPPANDADNTAASVEKAA